MFICWHSRWDVQSPLSSLGRYYSTYWTDSWTGPTRIIAWYRNVRCWMHIMRSASRGSALTHRPSEILESSIGCCTLYTEATRTGMKFREEVNKRCESYQCSMLHWQCFLHPFSIIHTPTNQPTLTPRCVPAFFLSSIFQNLLREKLCSAYLKTKQIYFNTQHKTFEQMKKKKVI